MVYDEQHKKKELNKNGRFFEKVKEEPIKLVKKDASCQG